MDEQTNYLKRKQSSTSKSKAKAKHKHVYTDVLFMNENKPYKGRYCKTCGKINDIKFFLSERKEGLYHVLTKEEVLEKYKHLKRVNIDDTSQKYVSITDM